MLKSFYFTLKHVNTWLCAVKTRKNIMFSVSEKVMVGDYFNSAPSDGPLRVVQVRVNWRQQGIYRHARKIMRWLRRPISSRQSVISSFWDLLSARATNEIQRPWSGCGRFDLNGLWRSIDISELIEENCSASSFGVNLIRELVAFELRTNDENIEVCIMWIDSLKIRMRQSVSNLASGFGSEWWKENGIREVGPSWYPSMFDSDIHQDNLIHGNWGCVTEYVFYRRSRTSLPIITPPIPMSRNAPHIAPPRISYRSPIHSTPSQNGPVGWTTL